MKRCIFVAVVGLGVVGVSAPAFAQGYGPAVPTGPAAAPGGYTSVVTTQTVGASGGTLTASVPSSAGGSAQLTVDVPSGALPPGTELVVTAPTLSAIQPALLGFTGYQPVGGFGFAALLPSGQPVGTFAQPVTVAITYSGPSLQGDRVLEITGSNTASVVPSTITSHTIAVAVSSDPDFVVVAPIAAAAASTPSGATGQTTGKPFVAETIGGVGLIAGGAVAFGFSLRRRRHTVGNR